MPLRLSRLTSRLLVALLSLAAATAFAQEKPDEVVTSDRPEKIERAAQEALSSEAMSSEPLPAEEDPPESVAVRDLPRDTSAVTPHTVAAEALDAFRTDPDFAYDRVVVQQPSAWEQFRRWFAETFLRPAGEAVPDEVQKGVIYALAIALLVFAVLKLLGADFGGVFARRETPAPTVEALDAIEAIEEVDLETLLREAERTEAWALAVRVRYLRLLQALAARTLIAWAPAKTDRAYLLDLEAGPRADLVPVVRDAARLFQATWYGDFDVDAGLYAEVRARFEAAESALGPPTALATGAVASSEAQPGEVA